MKDRPRLLRITTVPISLKLLLKGQLTFMSQQGFEVLAVSSDGVEVKSIREERIKHRIVPFTRKITPLKDLVCIYQLVKIIREFKPDIIHTHTPKAGLLGMIAGWLCRVPARLHTVAGLPLMEARGIKRSLLEITERLTYRLAHDVYPNSLALRDYIMKEITSSAKLRVIGKGSSNGIDTEFFQPSAELNLKATEFKLTNGINHEVVFSFVGRIVSDKGVNELVKAFDELSREFSCALVLVGPFEDDLDPISDETRHILKNNKNIICSGYLNDVRPAILSSDVFVLPSYREGFPNVVMQACCLERACIVTNINGCNEIINDTKTGLIVEPKQSQPLYDAMKFMIMHPEERKAFGKAARTFVAANYDQSYLWDLLLSEYKNHLQ
jgi:glycosyltransferase involved in cell wall biosynthesis